MVTFSRACHRLLYSVHTIFFFFITTEDFSLGLDFLGENLVFQKHPTALRKAE